MKVLLINVTENLPEEVQGIFQEVFHKVCRGSNELVIRDITPGLTRMTDLIYGYGRMINARPFCERAIEAQRQGFDAVVTNCTFDVGVREARELVDIPVVATAESTVHYAALLGNKMGVVSMQEKQICLGWEKVLVDYGFQSRAIVNAVRGVNLSTYDAGTKGMADNSIIVRAVEEKAKELASDGAEVIIIGCGLYGPVCTKNGFVKLEGDIPLVDPMAIAYKMAEVMVDFKNTIGLPAVTRVGLTPRMPDKSIQRIREHVGLTG